MLVRVLAKKPIADLSDGELVITALGGETWALEALFRRHHRAVLGTVIRLLRRREEAEDLVQETFTVALTELARLRDPQAFEAWLLQIAVRRIYRRLRKQKLLRFLGLDHGTDDATLALLAHEGATQETSAELALLDRVLEKMPAEERVAWMLRHVEGESVDRVATILRCSRATAKRRIKAAQDRIAAHARTKEANDG